MREQTQWTGRGKTQNVSDSDNWDNGVPDGNKIAILKGDDEIIWDICAEEQHIILDDLNGTILLSDIDYSVLEDWPW